MCFETRDRIFASVCKERDDLKKRLAAATEVWSGLKEELEAEILRLTNIAEHQANMNHLATELALQLDTVTADRNRLQEAYEAMSRDLEKMSARVNEGQSELAKVKAERDAAVLDLRTSSGCWHCERNGKTCHMIEPVERPKVACGAYVWQGMEGK